LKAVRQAGANGSNAIIDATGRDKKYVSPLLHELRKRKLLLQKSGRRGQRRPWKFSKFCQEIMNTERAFSNTIDQLTLLNQMFPKSILGNVALPYIHTLIAIHSVILLAKARKNKVARELIILITNQLTSKLLSAYGLPTGKEAATKLLSTQTAEFGMQLFGTVFDEPIRSNGRVLSSALDLYLSILPLLVIDSELKSDIEKGMMFAFHSCDYSDKARRLINKFLRSARKTVPDLVIPQDIGAFRLRMPTGKEDLQDMLKDLEIVTKDPTDPYYHRLKTIMR
jgi:hypothetical protein